MGEGKVRTLLLNEDGTLCRTLWTEEPFRGASLRVPNAQGGATDYIKSASHPQINPPTYVYR